MESLGKDFADFIGTILGRRWFMLQRAAKQKSVKANDEVRSRIGNKSTPGKTGKVPQNGYR